MREPSATRPEAVWFGHDRPRSFAMLHRPARPSGRGVVICNTLGFEGLLAHRPFRHLAEALAAQGFTVLRLDYEGTGDAAGDLDDPEHVDGLLECIDDAVELVRTREGCTAVSLIGIRLGAALACRYALDHPVDSLVLWAPCDRGSLYVRELKALHRLSSSSRPDQGRSAMAKHAGAPLEVVGFLFGDQLLDELAAISLAKEIDRSPARRVFVLDRDDTASSTDLVGALLATGTTVDHREVGGWSSFMTSDETQSDMPVEALGLIEAWMDPWPNAPSVGVASLDLRRRNGHGAGLVVASRLDGAITEHQIWIDGLFAIMTEQPDATPGRRAVIVMANTGSVNRSGPGRLYAQLARRWAALGFTVIRVDLGGTGDSAAPAGSAENEPYSSARTSELLAVVDWARANTDAADVTLFGICSGAFHSFHAAVRSGAVERLILVNPVIFYLGADDTVRNSTGRAVTAAHNLQRIGFLRQQLPTAWRSPRELIGFVWRAARGLRFLWAARARRFLARVGMRMHEPDDLARDLDALDRRGIATLAVFASAEPGARYLRSFGGTTLTRLIADGAITVIDIEGGDHVFSPPDARRAMADAVTGYLETVQPALSLASAVPREA